MGGIIMRKLILGMLIVGLMFGNVGCASIAVFHHNKQQLREARQARGEANVEPTMSETIGNAPWLTVGAAVADIASGVAAYTVAAKQGGGSDQPKATADNNVAGGDQINVSGNNNTVVIDKPVAVVPPVIVTPPAAQ